MAKRKDWSLAELLRRSAEAYLQTLPESVEENWQMPVMRRSGGYLTDPAKVCPESDVIRTRSH